MDRILMHWILCLVLFLFKYVLSFERFEKLKVYFVNNIKKSSRFLFDCETGLDTSFGRDSFRFIIWCYSMLFAFIFMGLLVRISDDFPKWSMIVVLIVMVALSSVLSNSTVFAKQRYVEYFKQFKKNDNSWHCRWGIITAIFYIGGILSAFAGIYFFSVIITGRFDGWRPE